MTDRGGIEATTRRPPRSTRGRLLRRAPDAARRGARPPLRTRPAARSRATTTSARSAATRAASCPAAARSSTTRCAPGRHPRGRRPSILFMDPPEHAGHRKLLNREFTPRSVGAARGTRPRAGRERASNGRPPTRPIDAVDQLTAPFPMLVIAELLGIPDGDRADFRRWSDATIESTDRPPEESLGRGHRAATASSARTSRRSGATRATTSCRCSCAARSTAARSRPTSSIIFLLTLLVAGNETTRTLLSGGMVALAEHPDQRAGLAADPERDRRPRSRSACGGSPRSRRSAAPSSPTRRSAGTRSTPATTSSCCTRPANRDERAFGPDRRPLRRRPGPVNPAHLAFGFGEHLCLGAALARLEAAGLPRGAAPPLPGYELAGEPERVASTLIAGIRTLPVVLAGLSHPADGRHRRRARRAPAATTTAPDCSSRTVLDVARGRRRVPRRAALLARAARRRARSTSACCSRTCPSTSSCSAAPRSRAPRSSGINPTRRGEELARDVRHTDCQLVVTSRRPAAACSTVSTSGSPPDRVLVVDDDGYRARLDRSPTRRTCRTGSGPPAAGSRPSRCTC